MTAGMVTMCLLLAAAAVSWPVPGGRSRLRAVLPAAGDGPGAVPGSAALRQLVETARRAVAAHSRGRLALALPVAAVVLTAAAFGGVVAAVAAGAYTATGLRAAASRRADRHRATRRHALLDQLAAAAADLRAGLPAGTALPVAAAGTAAGKDARRPEVSDEALRSRVRAVSMLAERTGAPLAELLDRIERDARSADRVRAGAGAQAAGARATAWLLAALPAGGLALGYAIGADPVEVLLHTPVGAASALGAVGLQLAGLAWTRRIMRAGGALS